MAARPPGNVCQDMSSPGTVLERRYRLDSRIATGGVGEVWRATDLVLGRPVAVKLLQDRYAGHPETLARFRAEAQHAGALSHPGIAQVYDYGEADAPGPPYLVLELVDGPSLAGMLARGPLDPAATMDVVAQAAAGLAAAHAAGLVHRDIKPANLLMGPGGIVKITDFGIAHAAGSAPLTKTGTLVGTPAYLAPERAAGARATPASDLYSLGIVAYECLAGTQPFQGTALEIAAACQREPLPPLPAAVPALVSALVAALTAKNPAARPDSAAQVAARAAGLRDALNGKLARAPAARISSPPATRADVPPAAPAGLPSATRADAPPATRADVPPAARADAPPATQAGQAGTRAGQAATQAGQPATLMGAELPPPAARPWWDRPRARWLVALAAVAVVAAALVGWLLAGVGRAPSRAHLTASHPATSRPAASQQAASQPAAPAGGRPATPPGHQHGNGGHGNGHGQGNGGDSGHGNGGGNGGDSGHGNGGGNGG
jgi:eukaryotic-like serine/threonine-protein kinase